MSKKVSRVLIKILKITGWFLLGLILLLVIGVYSLRFPAVQDYITSKALSYFHEKVDTEANIGRLYVDFPSNITIENLYVEDQKGDTLVHCNYLTVQTDLWALMDNQLALSEVEIDGLVGNVLRPKGEKVFNYQFIVDAFSTPKEQTADTSAGFDFSIGVVSIEDTRVVYLDAIAGLQFQGSIGQLLSGFDVFDVNQPKILFSEVSLANVQSNLRLFKGDSIAKSQPKSATEETDVALVLGGNEVKMNNVRFNFEDVTSNIKLNNHVGELLVKPDAIDINQNIYTAKQIAIKNSFISFDQFTTQLDSAKEEKSSGAEAINILAGAGQVAISNTSFRYYDHNQPKAEKGFDPSHLWLQKANIKLSDSYFENGEVHGDVKSLTVKEKNGLSIDLFQGQIAFEEKQSFVKGLKLKTGDTNLKGDLQLNYPSIQALADQPTLAKFDVLLDKSRVDLRNLFYFSPELQKQLSLLDPYYQFNITTSLKGTLDNLTIGELQLQALDTTSIIAKGTIQGLPDINKTKFDIKDLNFKTGRKDVKKIVADSLLPPNLNLPVNLQVKADFNGFLNDFKTKADIKTSSGNIDFTGSMRLEKDSVYSYKGDIKVKKLQLGQLLSNEDLGLITLDTRVDGRGFDIKTLNTSVEGDIVEAYYQDYKYEQVKVNGRFKNKQFDGQLAFADQNLEFDFDGLVNLNDSIPEYRFKLDLKKADFQALNFTKEEFKARAKVNANLKAESLETLDGSLDINDVTIAKSGQVYQLDSMALVAKSDAQKTDLKFNSSILNAEFKGNFVLTTLPEVLQNHFNRYFNLSDNTKIDTLKSQDFVFKVDFKDPGFFKNVLVPDLEEFVPGKVEGKYNSDEWLLDIDIVMDRLAYKGTEVDSLGMKVTSDRSSFSFNTKVATLTTAGYDFNNLLLSAKVEGEQVKTDFKILGDEGKDRYHLGGKLGYKEGSYVYQFLPGEFMLNYEKWRVDPANQISFHDYGFWVSDMNISQDGQQISLQSETTQEQDSLLNAEFDNFDLAFLGKFKETEAYILGGILNGNFTSDIPRGSLKADLSIKYFSYLGDTLGNIDLLASNRANKTDLNLSVTSKSNEVLVEGTVLSEEATKLDLNAEIKRLDVSTVESYAKGQVSDLKGQLTGDLKVTGTVADPDIKGKMVFNEVFLKVNYLGASYSLDKEIIQFTKNGLSFDKFTVLDNDNNQLSIDGSINSADYREFNFDLKVSANSFQLLNTTEKDNQLVFGKLRVNTETDITGSLQNPKVRMNLSVADNSDVTYLIPESEIEVQNRKGVVEFYDADLEEDDFFGERKLDEEDTVDMWISGVDLRANIDVNKSSTFGVIIDPITRDKLIVSGDADLTLAVRPSGDMTMTGRYEVDYGSYDLNFYGIAKRKFEITSGSYLLWTGDPLNARMDVSASYAVRASPVDAEINRKIPFTVFLNIKGELLAPEISFRLALQEEGAAPPSVQSWIATVNQQESVLNRQVFSLLLFKSFLTASGTSGNGNIAQSTARNSVSRILSNQLNRLGSKIEGVELSFDLQSYQDFNDSGSTVGRTELELGLSKQFFDNRVVVKVAGNFDLEGKQSEQQSASDFAGDIKIEYKLTEDGRFRLVGFRENEYDNLLQGEIAKTGVGVIFVRDYNALKELFRKEEKEEEEEDEDQ